MYSVNESLIRQSDIIPMNKLTTPITIIGAGAIGSWVALSLAKMGFSLITVYDNDEVSVENLASQFYPHTAIGKPKVEALNSMVEAFTGYGIEAKNELYTNQSVPHNGILISAVDSMKARKTIWQAAKTNMCGKYIDPRMGAESMMMYVMNPSNEADVTSYEKTLYSDENAEHERCTAKTTMYCANILAGYVVHAAKNLACGEGYHRILTANLRDHGHATWVKEAV